MAPDKFQQAWQAEAARTRVTIDADKRLLQLEVDPAELQRRRAAWKPPAPRYPTGVLAKYARLVGSAAQGAVMVTAARRSGRRRYRAHFPSRTP